MKKNITAPLAIILCASMAAAPSFARTTQGAYVNGNLGFTQFPNLTFKDASNNSISMSSKLGMAGGLALGSQNDNLRMEIAANYWENRIKQATINPVLNPLGPKTTNHGTSSILLAMINGYYDFTPQESFTPYLGLGIGAARFRPDVVFDSTHNARSSHNEIAYQAIVGTTWDVAPCVKANLDYRYLLTGPQKVNVNQPTGINNLRKSYQNHRVSVGLTYYIY